MQTTTQLTPVAAFLDVLTHTEKEMCLDEQQITLKEAAEISGLSEHWLRTLMKRDQPFLASKPYGNHNGWRIYRPSLEEWMENRKPKYTLRKK